MKWEVLYHYTSLDTFVNIIRNREFRLYDITKSNDPLEGKYILQSLETSYRKLYQEEKIDKAKYMLVHRAFFHFTEELNSCGRMVDFCGSASFCVPSHELTMLRCYGDNGKGVAIGVPISVLKSLTSNPDIEFKKIRYISAKELETKCDQFWLEMLNKYDILGMDYTEDGLAPLLSELKQYYRDGFFVKDIVNCDEEEYRLLVYKKDLFKFSLPTLVDSIDENIDFYCGNGDLKAYYKLPLQSSEEDGFTISDVIPGPLCKATTTEINVFLRKNGFFNNNITPNTWVKMR